jgi:hypothetical protein
MDSLQKQEEKEIIENLSEFMFQLFKPRIFQLRVAERFQEKCLEYYNSLEKITRR